MTSKKFDPAALQKLTRDRVHEDRRPRNGVTTPSPQRVKEAVREANDPKRLISDPSNCDYTRR